MTIEQKSASTGMKLPGLADKVAVVTGGSSGIGRATVVALARAGAKVAFTTHSDISEGEEVLRELQPFGKKMIVRQVDVSREQDVDALFDACERELGTPSLLVNSAGINAAGIAAVDMTLDHWEKTLSTNLTSAFLTCRALARRLRARSSPGRIVNISSVHETIVFPGGADYDASKSRPQDAHPHPGDRTRAGSHQCERDRSRHDPYAHEPGGNRGSGQARGDHAPHPVAAGGNSR